MGKNYEEKQTNMISILHFYCTKIQQIFDHLHTSSSQRSSMHRMLCLMDTCIFYLFYLEKIVKKVVVIKHYILQSPYVIFNVRVICLFRKLSSAFVLFFMNYIMVLHISLVTFQITLILYNPFYILVNCI